MARVIVKQSNGKLAIWSTVVDNFIAINGTEEDIINFMIRDDIKEHKKSIEEADDLFDSYCETLEEMYDSKEVDKINKLLSKNEFMVL